MKNSFWLALVLALAGAVEPCFAQSHELKNRCTKILNTRELVDCAQNGSPEVIEAGLEVERSALDENSAGQWRNPEFSLSSVQGNSDDQARGETDLALSFPVEIGGGIAARRAIARAESKKAEAELSIRKFSARTEMILKLHRLRQVYHEKEIVEESAATFSKLVEQYARRPSLSPEQRVSSLVFQMARSEYEIKKNETVGEWTELDSFFRVTVGKTAEELKPFLVPGIADWPEIGALLPAGISPWERLLEADVEASQGKLSFAQSESWPVLNIGPSMKIQREGEHSTSLVGFNLSLPLPLFHFNGAGRAVAAKGLALSEIKKANFQWREKNRRERLVLEYTQMKKILKNSISHDELEKRHRQIDSLFLKGLVSSALVIEAHRTYVDLEKSRNEIELRALEVVHLISSVDGKPSEFGL